jgi:hypothetical protein
MKKMSLLLFIIFCGFILPQVPPNEGDVVINTFDSRYGINNTIYECVVLANRTNTTIDLNGYELRGFALDGVTEYSYYQWNSEYLMQPYSFLLISTTQFQDSVPIPASDLTLIVPGAGNWDDWGYIVLRKQPSGTPLRSDYIDVVKYGRSLVTFTGVPEGSDMTTGDAQANVGSNSQFQLATRGGISSDLNSLTYTGYNVASDFSLQTEASTTIQNSNSSPLPVELSAFSALVQKDGIKLIWQTETEVNNYGFEIERTSIVKDQTSEVWEKMGFVNGSGNSNSPKNYSYQDMNVISGKYSYRLKQIDTDGKFEYSKAIEVNLNGPGKFELSQNYPNPFNPTTTIKFSIPEAGYVKLTLYNILAQEIKTLINESKEAGVHTINFNASDLNSGLYIYKLEVNGLTQTRKMTLVK